MSKRFAYVGLALLSSILIGAQPPSQVSPRPAPGATKLDEIPQGTGVVAYDPGAPADTFYVGAGGVNNYFVNYFDTRVGNPLDPGTVYAASFYQGAVQAPTGVIVFGPGASGPLVSFTFGAPVAAYAFNAFSFPPRNFTPPFRMGVGVYPGLFGSVGGRSASTQGMGFHGRQVGFSGVPSSALPGQNVMFRVAGSVWVVPVELMEFGVQ